jgi:teichoic acid transport system permease protein
MTGFYSKASLKSLPDFLVKIHYIADFSHRREAQHSSLAVLVVFFKSLLMLTVMWGVFTYGLKAKVAGGIGYFSYFGPGFIAWTLFSDSIISAYKYLTFNRFICENSKVRLDTILISHIYKNFQVQLLLLITLGLTLGLTSTTHINFNIQALLIGLIYLFSISISLSALVVILTVAYPRLDFYLNIIVSIIFWITPIVWSSEILPDRFQLLTILNPFNQLVSLYRLAFGFDYNYRISSITMSYFIVFFVFALFSIRFFNQRHLAILDGLK